jgi:hypothetical protein
MGWNAGKQCDMRGYRIARMMQPCLLVVDIGAVFRLRSESRKGLSSCLERFVLLIEANHRLVRPFAMVHTLGSAELRFGFRERRHG